jgi:hypothetical protein
MNSNEYITRKVLHILKTSEKDKEGFKIIKALIADLMIRIIP